MPDFHQSYSDRLELARISYADAVRNTAPTRKSILPQRMAEIAQAYEVNVFDLELVFYLKGETA